MKQTNDSGAGGGRGGHLLSSFINAYMSATSRNESMPIQKLVWESSWQQELMTAKKEQQSMAVSSRVGQENVAPPRNGTEFSPTKESAWRARSQGHGAWKHYVKCKSQTRESTYCPILSM